MNTISWNISSLNLVDIYRYFENTYCSHLHGRKPPIRRNLSPSHVRRTIVLLCNWDRLDPIDTATITGPSAPAPVAR